MSSRASVGDQLELLGRAAVDRHDAVAALVRPDTKTALTKISRGMRLLYGTAQKCSSTHDDNNSATGHAFHAPLCHIPASRRICLERITLSAMRNDENRCGEIHKLVPAEILAQHGKLIVCRRPI